MFAKSKVSQSMIDAVNKVLGEQPVEQKDQLLNEAGTPIKEPTSTGMRVFGGSYGNSAKAKKDQTKSPVDNLKGPKDKEMKEAAKPDFLDMDKDGNKKESMKKAIADKSVKEELKGDQHKIDANNNNKIDSQDFKILRGKKKVKEGREFTEKLLEMVRKSDVPAYLRKAKGDTPLTMADVKAPKKDTISDPKNLAKARNEEVELNEATYDYKKAMQSQNPRIQKKGIGGAMDAATKRIKQTFKDVPHNSLEKPYKEEVEQLDEVSSSEVDHHFNQWTNSEHAPYNSDAGDDKKVHQSAMSYLRSTNVPKEKHEKMAMHIAHKFHGSGIDEEVEHIEEKEGYGGSDPLANRASYAKKHGTGQVYKKTYPGDKVGMTRAHAYDIKRTGPKGKLPEEVELDEEKEVYEPSNDAITTDTLAGRMPGGKFNSFKSFKTRVSPLSKESGQKPGDDTPEIIQPQDTPARKSHEVKEATIAGLSGWEKVKTSNVKDKSGAIHTPMSRAKDLAQKALKTVQNKTKVK